MTSLIIEARVKSYKVFVYLCLGDDIFRTLERIESNQPYQTTLVFVWENFFIENQVKPGCMGVGCFLQGYPPNVRNPCANFNHFPLIFPLFSPYFPLIFPSFSPYFPLIFPLFSPYFPLIFPLFTVQLCNCFSFFT